MTKNIRLLLCICLLAITGVVSLQFLWVRNYYQVSFFNFEREVNLAFEDAVKKEFQSRCDTIENLLVEQLMDTSSFIIRSIYFKSSGLYGHQIINAGNKKDSTSFSHREVADSLVAADTIYKKKIARAYARALRSEDLEHHIVYYHTQNLGQFVADKIQLYSFDTVRLRPALQDYLNKRSIGIPFYFRVTRAESMLNYIEPGDSIFRQGVVATKPYPTYKWWTPGEQFVRAVFSDPQRYVIRKMKWILGGSLLLIVLVALSIGLLIKALLQEKRLSVIKNDFINNITHELKTPVATVSAAVESLQDLDLPGEKTHRYLGHARNEMDRLAKLVDSILDISLYEKNKLPVQQVSIPIDKTLKAIMEQMMIAAGKPVHYQYINTAVTSSVKADKLLFHQVLSNVLDNAIKYSGDRACINITCYTDEKYFHIKCTDEGEGIASSSMPHIFEKFYREPKLQHAVKGYGLGLNYVKEIMKAHHGHIGLTSVKGKGTIVILSWPL